ncbi:uncharacterized protein [Apostichopus japonicus]|uniref:uncharacterized protein isoform X2 n=1 Tax=Stichopus japonicus TaxID=307972 RepID=UPI003AB39433
MMEDCSLDQQLASDIIEQLADENVDQIEITIVQAEDGSYGDQNHPSIINIQSAENTETLNVQGQSDPESSTTRLKKKPARSSKKYRKEWEMVPEYELWLTESTNDGYAFCMVCECDISVDKGKAQLTRHSMRQKHIENEKAMRRGEASRINKELQEFIPVERIQDSAGTSEENKGVALLEKFHRRAEKPDLSLQTQLAEAQIVAFIVEYNLPLSLVDRLVAMIKDLPAVGTAIKKIHLGKQKATNMVRQGFAPFFKDILVEKLKTTLFSVVIEEAIDKAKKSKLASIFVSFSNEDLKMEVDLLEFVECDTSHHNVYGKFKDCMKKIELAGVPMKNWIGFRSDISNAEEDSQSLSGMIREDYPWVVSIKCPIHMIKLSTSTACESLPSNLEDFLHIIHHHFVTSLSSMTQAPSLVTFEKFYTSDVDKRLTPGQTLWLSDQSIVKLVVSKWPELQVHFTNVVMEESNNGHDLVLEVLLSPIMRVMALFMDYVLGVIDNFCSIFQKEEPLFYHIEKEVQELVSLLAKSFMTKEYLDVQTDFLKLQVNEEDAYLPLSQVYIGYEATSALTLHMQELQLMFDDSDVVFALNSAREFYKALIVQIQSRFDFTHPIYKFINIINPVNAYNTDPPSLMEFFANFLHPDWSKRSMEEEWRSVCLLGLPSDDILLSPSSFWKFVLSRKTPTGMNRFQHLHEILRFFLSLPYSKTASDKMVTLMRDVRTNSRRYLKTITLSACLRSHCGLRRVPNALINPHLRKRLEKVKSNAKSGECNDMPILEAR